MKSGASDKFKAMLFKLDLRGRREYNFANDLFAIGFFDRATRYFRFYAFST